MFSGGGNGGGGGEPKVVEAEGVGGVSLGSDTAPLDYTVIGLGGGYWLMIWFSWTLGEI